MRKRFISAFLFFSLVKFFSFAGNDKPLFVSGGDIFGTRNFIENKGQYVNPLGNPEEILFVYDHSGEKIYFTKKGLIYELIKREPFSQEKESERERKEKGKNERGEPEGEDKPEVHYVMMNWQESNPSVSVVSSEKQEHYFTYGEARFNSFGFKKITYQNIYPGIDIEYTIPANKTHGIKYSFVLHEGANPDNIKISYAGDVKKITLLKNGDVSIKTSLENIIEHAPDSYNKEGQPIVSSFTLKDNVIGFGFPESYDKSKGLVIDPWVTVLTFTTGTWNSGYDVDHDVNGNTFVFGSNSYFKLAKYTSSGSLSWTFMGSITSLTWTSNSGWIGGMVVEKSTGKTYLSRQWSSNMEVRLDANGNYDNWTTIGTGSTLLTEMGDCDFDCNGNLIVFGGAYASVKLVSIPGASISLQATFHPTLNACCQDITCHAFDDFGNLFTFMGAWGTLTNTINQSVPGFTNSVWVAGTGFNTFGEANGRAGLAVNPVAGSWFKCLAVNGNYLYYYDGHNLAAYNKSSGSSIATTTVSGVTVKQQGGIAVDECDNIYLGGNGSIICYSFNGASFSTLTPIAINSGQTTEYVYDIQLDKTSKILYVTGSSFVGTYSATSSSACVVSYCGCVQPLLSFNTTSTTCANIGASTVNVTGVPGPFTYSWMPGGQTSSVVTGLSPGTYTVSITSLSCNGTYTGATTFSSATGGYSINVVSQSITCASLGSATVSSANLLPPFNYTWAPTAQTGSVATGLSPGIYTLTVHSGGCNFTYTTTTSFTSLIPLTGSLSYTPNLTCPGAHTGTATVNNLAGGSTTQNFLWTNGTTSYTTAFTNSLSAGLWSVNVTDALTGCQINNVFLVFQPPALSLSLSAATPTACAGTSISLSGINSGGTPGYTYTWTAGPANTGFVVSNTTAGTYVYTLNSTDANNCLTSNTISVDFIANPVLSVSNVSICPLAIGTLTVGGASTYSWSNGVTANSFTASPVSTTQYTVIGSAQSCTSSAVSSIILKPLPFAIINSNGPVCNAQSLQLYGYGGVSNLWSGPLSFTSSLLYPAINPAAPGNSGVYSLTVTSANGCTASTGQNITVNPTPTLSANGGTVCTTQVLNLSSNSFPGSTYLWSGPLSYTSSQQNPSIVNPVTGAAGTYTVRVTSAQGCTNVATVSAGVVLPPSLSAALSDPTLCAHSWNGSPNFISINLSGANTYTLTAPSNFINSNPSGPLSSLTTQAPFFNAPSVVIFTMQGSNGVCTSIKTESFTVIANPSLMLSSYTPSMCAGKSYNYWVYGASTYTWTNIAGLSAYTGSTTIASPALTTIYSVVGSSLGCNGATETSTLSVLPIPTFSLNPKTPTVCLNSAVNLTATGTAANYFWSPGTGLNSLYSAVVSANPLVDQTYTILGFLNTCTNTAQITVSVLPLPTPTAVSSKSAVCAGNTLTISGYGGEIYNWKGPSDLLYSGKILVFTASSTHYGGTYTLIVTDKNGCKASTTIPLVIYTLPAGSLNGTRMNSCVPFCSDFSYYSATGASSLIAANWEIDNKLFGTRSFSYCFSQPGEYIITGKFRDTSTNCMNTQTFVVSAWPNPIADFNYVPETPVENNEVIFISNSEGENLKSWNWFFIDNEKPSSKTQNTSYIFPDPGTYPVAMIVSNTWGCSDTVVKLVRVDEDPAIYVPNAFSPNEDGLNDIFLPVTRGLKFYKLMIFNRWGNNVFSSIDSNVGWDGTYQGDPCQDDVYTWKIVLSKNSGESKTITGHVTLYR